MLALISLKDMQPIAVTRHPAAIQFNIIVAYFNHNDINTLAPPPLLDVINFPRTIVLNIMIFFLSSHISTTIFVLYESTPFTLLGHWKPC